MNANAQHDAMDHAIDNSIDRALSALRDARPRPGLEGRILALVEHRTVAAQPARFHLSAQLVLWAATSAAILAIALLVVVHHGPASEPARSAQQRLQPNTANSAEVLEPAIKSREVAAEPAQSTRRHVERSAARRRISVLEDSQAPQSDGLTTTPTDAQALADLRAPSHPAPPLPLTPQEKLFLRMLRYGNATQLAELNPIVREQHDAAEAADFKTFFPDPPPLQQPNGDTE